MNPLCILKGHKLDEGIGTKTGNFLQGPPYVEIAMGFCARCNKLVDGPIVNVITGKTAKNYTKAHAKLLGKWCDAARKRKIL